MKRSIVNVILIAGFILLMTVIILPFAAEIEFARAKKLEVGYRWSKAGEKYQAAVRLNPFNAEYFAGAGDFMLRQSAYCEDKTSWLKRAEKLSQQACRLNPRYAEYWYLLGEAQIEIGRNEIEVGVDSFRKAIGKDPYNFRNNYLIGDNLLSVWNHLGVEQKKFTLARLKYVLQLRPYYGGKYVYPAIMYYTKDFSIAREVMPKDLRGCKNLLSFIKKNNLWQYRKGQKELVNSYRRKEEPEELEKEREEKMKFFRSFVMTKDMKGWIGKSKNGKNEYKNGNMYWTGTVNAAVEIPLGKARINITAKGSPANEVFPYMIVELDGEEIGERFVDSSQWKEYSFEVDTDGGLRILSVTFTNDGGNKEKGEDRNLYVGETQITQIINTDYTDER